MYKVVMMSWGGTVRDLITGLSLEQAQEFCESCGWEWCPDGGYVWDLDIEEE